MGKNDTPKKPFTNLRCTDLRKAFLLSAYITWAASKVQEQIWWKYTDEDTYFAAVEMENEGYKMEVKIFDGNNLPALALSANEIDGLILNHKPWIDTFNKANNSHLVLVDGFKYASLNALYSSKHKTLEDIPDNAVITISNDPSNMDRGLRFLEKLGLLKLGEKTGEFYTMIDIKENPKNIKFLEVETTSTAGSYADADATITFSSVMKNAGFDAHSYIVEDGEYNNFPTGLVVNEGNENSQWAKDIVKVTQTEEYKNKFNEIFKGAYIIY